MQVPSPSDTANSEPVAPDAVKTPRKVSRTLINFWLDVALFLAIVFLLWISAILQVVFPAPTLSDGWSLWGLSFDQWRDVQFYSLCACALLALEHLVLHWNWVCSVIATQVLRVKGRPDEGSQAIYGVGTFIVLVILMMCSILAAMLSVRPPKI